MRTLILTLVFLIATPALAQGYCSNVEVHPETRQTMSGEEWQSLKDEWSEEEPTNPGALVLLAAYAIYAMEKDTADQLRGDKRKHCYMGCRIARRVSYNAAVYAAWLKEYEDLDDCNPNTYFEWRDYEVTVNGADAAVSMGRSGDCFEYCRKQPRR